MSSYEKPKTFSDLTVEEFDQLLDRTASPDLHDMPINTFFTALAALDEEWRGNTAKLSGISNEEFRRMLSGLVEDEATDLTDQQFFDALAAIDEEWRENAVELKATVKDGQLAFLEPAPLPVRGKEFTLGAQRVIISLVAEASASVDQPALAAD